MMSNLRILFCFLIILCSAFFVSIDANFAVISNAEAETVQTRNVCESGYEFVRDTLTVWTSYGWTYSILGPYYASFSDASSAHPTLVGRNTFVQHEINNECRPGGYIYKKNQSGDHIYVARIAEPPRICQSGYEFTRDTLAVWASMGRRYKVHGPYYTSYAKAISAHPTFTGRNGDVQHEIGNECWPGGYIYDTKRINGRIHYDVARIVEGYQPNTDDHDGDGVINIDDLNSQNTEKKYLGKNPNNCPINRDQNFVANPINIFNGNKFESVIDVSFPSPFEGGLKFQRYYNSLSESDSSIGYGWTHTYNYKLNKNFAGSSQLIEILDSTGRGVYFEDNDQDGTFKGAFDENSSIVIGQEGDYVWTRDDGSVYVFGPEYGRLFSVTDKNGNQQILTYDANNYLLSITDTATGRTINFNYNADNRIHYISGPVTTAIADGIWVSYQYDSNGNLIQVTYADDGNGSTASGFIYEYQDAYDIHNLTAKKDLDNHLLSTWTYDANDQAVSNVNNQGTSATIDYSDPLAVKVTDDYGIDNTYTIVEIKGSKKITEKSASQSCGSCSDGIFKTEFDPNTGYPVKREYFNGRIDLYQNYDSNNNPQTLIIAQGTPDEKTIYKTWHPVLSSPLTETKKSLLADTLNPDRNRETIWDYDDPSASGDTATPNENPTNRIYKMILKGFTLDDAGAVVPFEQVTSYTYNTKGQITSVNGPLAGDQDLVSFAYDDSTGDMTSVTRPLTGTVSFTHDAAGNIITQTDENQVETVFGYDGRNRQISAASNGVSDTRTFNAAGDLASVTDRSGRIRSMTYNTKGFLQRLVDPSGNYQLYTYDENGNPIESSIYTSAGVQALFSGLDYGDPLTNAELAPGKPAKALAKNQDNTATLETLFAYEHGNLVRVTDPMSTVKQFTYDKLNRMVQAREQQTDTVNADTSYVYDANNNLIQVTDPEGRITSYTYDDANRIVKEVSPDTGTTTYLYDAAGNLVSKKTNDGTIVQYTYDLLGRRTTMEYPDTGLDVIFMYDQGTNGIGRLTGISNDQDTYGFTYDASGNLTQVQRTTPSATFTTTYSYDAAGRLTGMVYPDGRTITYERDANGEISKVTTTKNGITQILAENIAYKPFGPVESMTLGSGQQVSKGFDLNYRPLTLATGNVLDYSLDYDPAGRIAAITDNLNADRTRSFGYDRAGRLTTAAGPFGNLGFTYDKTGNRLTKTKDGISESYTYTLGTNHLTQVADSNGATSLTYDTNGKIKTKGNLTFEYTDAGRMLKTLSQGNVIQESIYNSFGQRTRKTANGTTTLYHYDLFGNLIGESDTSGNFSVSYVYLNNTRLAGFTGSNAHFYLNDHLGTPVKVLDNAGQVVWDGDYAPFGQVNVTVNNLPNAFRFPGQYYDSATGLHYNWHRYYDPATGRYLTPDPIGLAGGINPFGYVLNDPINKIDPLGLYDLENYFYDSITGTTDNPGEFADYQYADHKVSTEVAGEILATTSLGSAAVLGVAGGVGAAAIYGPEITTGALYTYNFISQNQMIAYGVFAGATMPDWPPHSRAGYLGWALKNFIIDPFLDFYNQDKDPCSN
ncbi:MAG: RHS repeat protein [Desulfobacter sp.]|nr:MAG: RHS repeat protein [Desulfobacter sp.]